MMIDSEDLIPRAFVPGLRIKIYQIKVYIFCMVCFYVSRIVYDTYMTINIYIDESEDEYSRYIIKALL